MRNFCSNFQLNLKVFCSYFDEYFSYLPVLFFIFLFHPSLNEAYWILFFFNWICLDINTSIMQFSFVVLLFLFFVLPVLFWRCVSLVCLLWCNFFFIRWCFKRWIILHGHAQFENFTDNKVACDLLLTQTRL